MMEPVNSRCDPNMFFTSEATFCVFRVERPMLAIMTKALQPVNLSCLVVGH